MADVPAVRPDAPFAEALREALRARGTTLQAVRDRLAAAGRPVGLSTLSSWQLGIRIPRAASLDRVAALEEVLDVPAGWLGGRVAATRGPAPRRSPDTGTADPELPTRDLGLTDRCEVDAHGRLRVVRSTLLVQAVRPTREVVVPATAPVPARPSSRVRLLAGARAVGAPDARGTVVVDLGRRLEVGETALIELESRPGRGSRAAGEIPGPHEVCRRLLPGESWYVLEVAFDPARLPAGVTAFRSPRRSGVRAGHPHRLSPDHRAHLVQRADQVQEAGFAWTWARGR